MIFIGNGCEYYGIFACRQIKVFNGTAHFKSTLSNNNITALYLALKVILLNECVDDIGCCIAPDGESYEHYIVTLELFGLSLDLGTE